MDLVVRAIYEQINPQYVLKKSIGFKGRTVSFVVAVFRSNRFLEVVQFFLNIPRWR